MRIVARHTPLLPAPRPIPAEAAAPVPVVAEARAVIVAAPVRSAAPFMAQLLAQEVFGAPRHLPPVRERAAAYAPPAPRGCLDFSA